MCVYAHVGMSVHLACVSMCPQAFVRVLYLSLRLMSCTNVFYLGGMWSLTTLLINQTLWDPKVSVETSWRQALLLGM